jgi:uncharacterized protein YceH (UPF0502 family)
MDIVIDHLCVRILGALIEKEVTTPDYYPLSLNGLVTACNQKSNRDPVMKLSEEEVMNGLDTLKEKRLVWQRSVAGARVSKYEHNLRSFHRFSETEMGILCVLMLRGPQTIGEIRQRTDRLCNFGSLDEVESTVRGLISREDGPFVFELPRQPGRKEPRFVHLFAGEEWVRELASAIEGQEESTPLPGAVFSRSDRIGELEAKVETLTEELHSLREEFDAFRKMLE